MSEDTRDSVSKKRKHRPGLQRVQIACERCRARKNKCDRKLPECSTCKAARAECIVVDRLTNRQYARGHVEGLESDVERLAARVQELELEADTLRLELENSRGQYNTENGRRPPISSGYGDAVSQSPQAPSPFGDIVEDINAVPRDVTSGRRYVGDSSGLFFGNIVQGVLLQADYKGEHGPANNALRLRVADRHAASSRSPTAHSLAKDVTFPDSSLAQKLQTAYFTCRWPALPFLHRTSFLEKHFAAVMDLRHQASPVSLFLTFMVFALGAIDVKRQVPTFTTEHIDYFTYATQVHLQALLKEDSMQTVQGLLLIGQFSINEHHSAHAWQVSGQAVRTAVDLGLHRACRGCSSTSDHTFFDLEMKKRIFWSAYALDRNVSITLGRPCALRDEDIDAPFPLNLQDDDISGPFSGTPLSGFSQPRASDMSSFLHIIKLRQLQSKIQALFYAADVSRIHAEGVQANQEILRSQLDEWIATCPRYSHPTLATFQSTEWFQIAYSHALLLLYRPSPANPVIDSPALQICADSAISLISSYSSLYAKNKITYTWIALHSLFMASITMLYTLYLSLDIRASTTKAVVRANVTGCLALFEVMSEYWPLAARCRDVIERLGNATLALFDVPTVARQTVTGTSSPPASQEEHFGKINAEFMEWFGNRNSEPSMNGTANSASDVTGCFTGFPDHDLTIPGGIDLFPDTMDHLFPQEFDMTIPMMMAAFENGPLMQTPRLSDASDGATSLQPNM